MHDRLYKKYIPKDPEPIMNWARTCLSEADRMYLHGERTISVKVNAIVRGKIAAFLLATASYQDMEKAIEEENWSDFEIDLGNFWGVIYSWDLGIRDFVSMEVRKLVSPSTPKSRLLDLVSSKPHWMEKEIEEDLLWLLNKVTVRGPQRKGVPRAES